MKKSFSAIALAIASLFNLNVRAEEIDGTAIPAPCEYCYDCGRRGGFVADFDATFLRYHRANGVGIAINQQIQYPDVLVDTAFAVGIPDTFSEQFANVPLIGTTLGFAPAEFDFDFSPRFSLGYESCDGLGVRGRYWKYNEAVVGPTVLVSAFDPDGPNPNLTVVPIGVAASVNVETYTLDAEVYQTIELNCLTTLEVSGGLRYVEFEETLAANIVAGALPQTIAAVAGPPVIGAKAAPSALLNMNSTFSGYGGLLGAQLNRQMGNGLSVFGRTRGTVLMSDRESRLTAGGLVNSTTVLPDVTCGMIEVAIGAQYSFQLGNAIATLRVGGEWQNWYNFTSELPVVGTSRVTSPMDVGFGGYSVGAGLQF